MFLSNAAIKKQLFNEFLNFKKLALDPGKPAELRPGTLIGGSSNADVRTGIMLAEKRLDACLGEQGDNPEENSLFCALFADLIAYKKASHDIKKNPFSRYARKKPTVANPCAWLVFAPLLLETNGDKLSYESEQAFQAYLKSPKIAFQFNGKALLEETGLYIAVRSNNHEMVNAFLCHEYSGYQLSIEDLKKLLSLTTDRNTRLALFRHSSQLIEWIKTDSKLQHDCVLNFEELAELWSILSDQQRTDFINHTNSDLWLKLLDSEFGKQKIEKLLGKVHFALLNKKIQEDVSIRTSEQLPFNLAYLTQNQQFDYLVNKTELNKLFPSPQGKDWLRLLSSLGYQINDNGLLITTRYVLPDVVMKAHNNLITKLVSLPVEPKIIVEALQKIEDYVRDPDTEKDYKDYLQQVGKRAVEKEYQTGSFVKNWIFKLLRKLKLMRPSPLHRHLGRLERSVNEMESSLVVIPGELMEVLPVAQDDKVYKKAIAAYFANDIKNFWLNIPKNDREKIIKEPIRFARLIHFLSSPDYRDEFFAELDEDSLKYFNTPAGLHQLVLDTPGFRVSKHLPILIEAMKKYGILFIEDTQLIVELLGNQTVFNRISPFLPFQSNNDNPSYENLLAQESILAAMPRPLPKAQVNRFLRVYCPDPHSFSLLLLNINNSNPVLAAQCWDSVSNDRWKGWYKKLDHAELWSTVLTHLELNDRLEFFEKLASGGKLDAGEFCDFLAAKNEAVFNTIWSKVPAPQWTTWIKENNLPSTTLSLLDTLPYPLRIQFFKAMLSMTPKEIANLCSSPDKTMEQLYLEDVKKLVASLKSVSEVKAKLGKLKDDKRHEFDESLASLIKAVENIADNFQKLRATDIKPYNSNVTYTFSFFKTYPYYQHLKSINASKADIDKLHDKVLKNPLFNTAKDEKETRQSLEKLAKAMADVEEHITHFKAAANVPTDLQRVVTSLKN